MTVQELITELKKFPKNIRVGQYKCLWARDAVPEFVPFEQVMYNNETNNLLIY